MTPQERNELVEKVTDFVCYASRNHRWYIEWKYGFNRDTKKVISALESLGYEIVRKEHLKPLQDAFVLQQVRAGNFTRHEPTKEELEEWQKAAEIRIKEGNA